MKAKITKASLLAGLQAVQNVVSLRSTLPILSNVLLKAEEGKLQLTTTDLELSVRAGVEADILKPGTTTLPARKLVSIIRELPDSVIELEVDDKQIASIRCDSSFYKINGLSEEEFPPVTIPEAKFAFTMERGVFRDMLRKTQYAASSDETRHVLNGVFMGLKNGKLAVVATDGRRMALVEREIDFPADAETSLIIPSKTVNELLHTLADSGDIKIHVGEKQAGFEFGENLVVSKLIEGIYPNFRQVIPSEFGERVTIERESLLIALRRVSLLTVDRSTPTKLVFGKGKLTVSTVTPDVGEAKESLAIKYAGKEVTVAFNPDYLMDPLKCLDNDEVILEITDDLSPGVVKCDAPFLYVLMPMKVN